MWRALLVSAAVLVLGAGVAAAATQAEKCERKKLKHSAVYAACRLKADARAKINGQAPDYDKCEDAFATKFAKAEEKAGAGVCPTEGDVPQMDLTIAEATDEMAEQLEAPDPSCPPGFLDRTTSEVITDHYVALANEDWPGVACNYHPAAFVINDQGVCVGPADIIAALQAQADLFGHQRPVISRIDVHLNTARSLFTLDTGLVVIEDGSESFVVERGRIRQQTVHAFLEFASPP